MTAVIEDLVDRPGYNPEFLGPGLTIPLPRTIKKLTNDLAEAVTGGHELRFMTYTVLLSRSTRLPVVSAANCDRSKEDTSVKRREWWEPDPRLALDASDSETLQVAQAWYDEQPQDAGGKIFDRGHLTAFENGRWGQEPLARGKDTFWFTNCAPQWREFNETGLWRQLERWATKQGTGPVTMFNGPIFDAPNSSAVTVSRKDGPEDVYELQLGEPPAVDRVVNGVPIPKLFFKVACYRVGDKLGIQSFVVTQEGGLAEVKNALDEADGFEAAEVPAKLTIYEVSVEDIQRLTGLQFGLDAFDHEAEAGEVPRRIDSLEDVGFTGDPEDLFD